MLVHVAGALRTVLSCPCQSLFVFGLLCCPFSPLHVVCRSCFMGGGF